MKSKILWDFLVYFFCRRRSWCDRAAERLDDLCEPDRSAAGINRESMPWWRT
jgi:hypothetical protein